MISTAELHDAAQREGLRFDQVVSELTSEALKEWNRGAWKTQLAPMMKAAPDYERVWDDWVRTSTTLLQAPGSVRDGG
jgi:hypothetical protein